MRPFSWLVWYFTLGSIPVGIVFWTAISYFSAKIHPEAEFKVIFFDKYVGKYLTLHLFQGWLVSTLDIYMPFAEEVSTI